MISASENRMSIISQSANMGELLQLSQIFNTIPECLHSVGHNSHRIQSRVSIFNIPEVQSNIFSLRTGNSMRSVSFHSPGAAWWTCYRWYAAIRLGNHEKIMGVEWFFEKYVLQRHNIGSRMCLVVRAKCAIYFTTLFPKRIADTRYSTNLIIMINNILHFWPLS